MTTSPNVVPIIRQRTVVKGAVEAQIQDVTPDIAREWLGRNTKNRNKKLVSIANYARDMKAGNWRMTGEAIKFDKNGVLLDGQNRAHAVIKADVTVQMLVITGLEPDTQEVMDGGSKRTNADTLQLHGIANPSTVAAIATVWVGYKANLWPHSGSQLATPILTHAEVLAVVYEHPELIEAGVVAARVYRQSLRVSTGALGTAWAVLHDVDASDADEFFDRIQNLRTEGRGDPVHTLIQRVRADRDAHKRLLVSETLFLILRAWNAWRHGDRLMKLTAGTKGHYYAMPVPK